MYYGHWQKHKRMTEENKGCTRNRILATLNVFLFKSYI